MNDLFDRLMFAQNQGGATSDRDRQMLMQALQRQQMQRGMGASSQADSALAQQAMPFRGVAPPPTPPGLQGAPPPGLGGPMPAPSQRGLPPPGFQGVAPNPGLQGAPPVNPGGLRGLQFNPGPGGAVSDGELRGYAPPNQFR